MESGTHKALSFWPLLAMVVSVQLGSAMFIVPNQLAQFGGWCLGGWVIAGMGALALCHVLAQLAMRYPNDGGPHLYMAHAFGPKVAFYVGWTYWILVWLASIPLLILSMDALQRCMGISLSMPQSILVQSSILGVLATMNSRGAVLAGWCETVLMVCKVIPLLLIPLVAWSVWSWSDMNSPSLLSPWTSISSSAIYAFWSFVGLEAATTLTPWAKNPKKHLPKALFWGTVLVWGVYVVNTASVLGTVPVSQLLGRCDGYALLLHRCLGPQWVWLMDVGMIVVCIGSLNSWILAGGQMLASGGQSGLFPCWVGRLNHAQSPLIAVLLTTLCLGTGSVVCSIANASSALYTVITTASALYLVIYIACVVALWKSMRGQSWSVRTFLCAGLSIILCGSMLASIPWSHLLGAALFPVSGWVFCRIFKWTPHLSSPFGH